MTEEEIKKLACRMTCGIHYDSVENMHGYLRIHGFELSNVAEGRKDFIATIDGHTFLAIYTERIFDISAPREENPRLQLQIDLYLYDTEKYDEDELTEMIEYANRED